MVDQGRIIIQKFGLLNLWNDCKTLIFGRHFIWRYKQKSSKYEIMKNSFEFSYTMSNKVAPMRLENKFREHEIEKQSKLNFANISVLLLEERICFPLGAYSFL